MSLCSRVVDSGVRAIPSAVNKIYSNTQVPIDKKLSANYMPKNYIVISIHL